MKKASHIKKNTISLPNDHGSILSWTAETDYSKQEQSTNDIMSTFGEHLSISSNRKWYLKLNHDLPLSSLSVKAIAKDE